MTATFLAPDLLAYSIFLLSERSAKRMSVVWPLAWASLAEAMAKAEAAW